MTGDAPDVDIDYGACHVHGDDCGTVIGSAAKKTAVVVP